VSHGVAVEAVEVQRLCPYGTLESVGVLPATSVAGAAPFGADAVSPRWGLGHFFRTGL
jgi:hypothetical protein